MPKRILVPLDEVVQAEEMIGAVGALAGSTGATVRLLHVAPVPESISDDHGHVLIYADQESARLEAEALDYLRAAAIALDGVTLEYGVRFGADVAVSGESSSEASPNRYSERRPWPSRSTVPSESAGHDDP
jgi:hypothetical protein